jgi:N-acetylmuramoyl-L-alanine amidase
MDKLGFDINNLHSTEMPDEEISMEPYEPPQNNIKIEPQSEVKQNFLHVKKNRIYIAITLLCFIAAACTVAIHFAAGKPANVPAAEESKQVEASATFNADALSGKLVVIDAGHGGFDPGTSGADGSQEDELNLQVSQNLKADLESYGAQVIMTRSDENALADTKEGDMAERRRIITESSSDIVVSIHMNSFTDGSVSGPLVLFMEGSSRGEKLARSIQKSLVESLKPAQENNARSGDLYILRSGNQPCVIVECGYLSNEKEEQQLKSNDYQQKLSQAICGGIINYFASDQE